MQHSESGHVRYTHEVSRTAAENTRLASGEMKPAAGSGVLQLILAYYDIDRPHCAG